MASQGASCVPPPWPARQLNGRARRARGRWEAANKGGSGERWQREVRRDGSTGGRRVPPTDAMRGVRMDKGGRGCSGE
jgi:hypothetical protein